MRRGTWPAALFILFILSVTWYISVEPLSELGPDSSFLEPESELLLAHNDTVKTVLPQVVSPARDPKITIIAIWTTRRGVDPPYLPYFFQSVKANPQVNLLFINVDKEGVGCPNYSDAPNVQV